MDCCFNIFYFKICLFSTSSLSFADMTNRHNNKTITPIRRQWVLTQPLHRGSAIFAWYWNPVDVMLCSYLKRRMMSAETVGKVKCLHWAQKIQVKCFERMKGWERCSACQRYFECIVVRNWGLVANRTAREVSSNLSGFNVAVLKRLLRI